MNFHAIFQYVCEQKMILCDILHPKTTKNHMKKLVKIGKSRDFQKSLKSSNRLHIRVYIFAS